MTYLTQAERSRNSAPNGSLMRTPDYLEALVTRDIKPVAWEEKVDQAKKLTALVHERRRREKLAKVERLMKGVIEREVVTKPSELNYLFHPFRMKRLMSVFCRVTGAKHGALVSQKRTKLVTLNRQFLMWILHKNTGQSLPAIGRLLGGRDHSTIIHGINKISKSQELLEQVQEIEKSVLMFEQDIYGEAAQ